MSWKERATQGARGDHGAPGVKSSRSDADVGRGLAGVSVVLPVYNNATLLPELFRRVRAALPDRPLEVVMVDDVSSDDSRYVMSRLDVKSVLLPRRSGQNAAILAGLKQATQPLTCVLDADLEDPPEALPHMLAQLSSGAAVVFSTREAAPKLSSRIFRWMIHRLFPSLPPKACLCFALDAEARQSLLAVASEGDYLVAVIGALKLKTDAVAVRRQKPRTKGSGYDGFGRWRYAARTLVSAARLRLSISRRRSQLPYRPR